MDWKRLVQFALQGSSDLEQYAIAWFCGQYRGLEQIEAPKQLPPNVTVRSNFNGSTPARSE